MLQPSILKYRDYRQFLFDYAQWQKREKDRWSYGKWSRELGFKSTSTITMILQRKRHLGKGTLDRFVDYFKFDPKEESYFKDLVSAQKQAGNDTQLLIYLMGKNSTPLVELSETESSLGWLPITLRELTSLPDCERNPLWFQARLREPVELKEIEYWLVRLLREGFIQENEGKLSPCTSPFSKEYTASDIHQFHSELSQLALKSLNLPSKSRSFHSTTLSISKAKLEKMQKFLWDFQVEFSKEFEESEGDEIYHLGLQFFPLTK